MPQRILDLAALPVLDVERVLRTVVDQFRPTLLVFSWRDIQIYAPVDGRGGNPLQNSFEVFYARNPLKRLRGALGGLLFDDQPLRRALAQSALGQSGPADGQEASPGCSCCLGWWCRERVL